MNIKGEISIKYIYRYIDNKMRILFLMNDEICIIYVVSYFMVRKVYDDIQDIHEYCFNWYLRHEY